MSRYHSYLNSAITIINHYDGAEPLASFLKKYFAANKKFGSKDRKQVAHLCYCYYRLGKALPDLPVADRVLIGLFLCSAESNEMLAALKPEWNDHTSLSLTKKIGVLNLSALPVFPWQDELSGEIDFEAFNCSHLIQPDLYLRIRPGNEKRVKEKLLKAYLDFKEPLPGCLALSNSSKVDGIIELDMEAVVQDYSSQQVGELLQLIERKPKTPLRIWDCCAASGGKSILAKDLLIDIDLTVSDVRESILANLRKRFDRAQITRYNSFVADLTHTLPATYRSSYDLIICDAPCTGSGTWSRTPEQLFYFDIAEVNGYVSLQKEIAGNTIRCLEPGGWLLYITCSVFKRENEEVVAALAQQNRLQLIRQSILKGYDKKADTLFAALLRKPC